MKKKAKQVFINSAILLVTVCLLILAAEVTVRFVSEEPDENNWVGAERKYYEYDPLLGWKKIPNTNTLRTSIRGRNKVLYQINSKSIRGPEYSYEKPADEYRILILGDSFADGYMIEFDDLFSEVLKSNLNNGSVKHIRYQVINTGTSGWSTDQELLFFQNEGKKYNPDLVILMFYENDITYNNLPKDWGMYYKPLFKIEDGKLVLTNAPVPKPDKIIYSDYLEPKEQSVFKRIRKWFHENSHLYNLIKERIKNIHALRRIAVELRLLKKPENENGSLKNNNAESDDWLLPMEYRVWERTPSNATIKSWKITETMIVKLKEEAESVDSKLLVFNIPFEGSIYLQEWEKLKKKYDLSDKDWDVNSPGLVLEDICKRNKIDFMNPIALFKAKAKEIDNEGIRLYDPIDHHWTVEGNRFTGEIIADYIYFNYLGDNR